MYELDVNVYIINGDYMSKRTDMAVEAAINLVFDVDRIISGMNLRKINVDEKLALQIKKSPGIYYNIDNIRYYDKKSAIVKLLSSIIYDCICNLNLKKDSKILICGLGNNNITPDSLGPMVINKIEVNSHIIHDENYIISAISPGVMGQTGMESSEIINSIVKEFQFDFVIVIDALACSEPSRMCHSIQLTTAGINPGSGIGNKRKEISKHVLGVDVLAIGIPTVSDIDCFVDIENDFFVTPKDIDVAIDILSNIIAEGINKALRMEKSRF